MKACFHGNGSNNVVGVLDVCGCLCDVSVRGKGRGRRHTQKKKDSVFVSVEWGVIPRLGGLTKCEFSANTPRSA